MHRETEKFWVCFSSWVLFLFTFSSCILIVLLHARRVLRQREEGYCVKGHSDFWIDLSLPFLYYFPHRLGVGF